MPIFVGAYLLVTLGIGVVAGRRVKTSQDFCLAGRKLSVWVCCASMFSTWFGAETIVGSPAEFLHHGILGIIEDPFGTTLCFFLLGRFFARKIYDLNLLTVSDFIRQRYGAGVERWFSTMMVMCYFGWIGAQFIAMSVVIETTVGVESHYSLWISATLVCAYTLLGGLWSVSYNDVIQTVVILVSLVVICGYAVMQTASLQPVLPTVTESGTSLFLFYPRGGGWLDWAKYVSAWIAIGFGDLCGQDVFQRVASAKSRKVAAKAAYSAAVMYLAVGLIPVVLTYLFRLIYPDLSQVPAQQVLIYGIQAHTGKFIQVLFFGALLSAIMSSASGGLIAVAVTVAENMVRPYAPGMSDRHFLRLIRFCVVVSGLFSAWYASRNPRIYHLLLEASAFSTATQFVTFWLGLYTVVPKAINAFCAMGAGLMAWGLCMWFDYSEVSALFGLMISFIAFWLPSLPSLGSVVAKLKQV
ncbi:MAG: sodium:solute symporter family protein [Zetaproteobacteria bacterium]|nr:sodium:solute symporter family protein [Zetaproteobacteria bacterium]